MQRSIILGHGIILILGVIDATLSVLASRGYGDDQQFSEQLMILPSYSKFQRSASLLPS